VERPLLEVALVRPGDRDKLASVCDRLSTGFRVVDDRVGLVTPRMISMVVNEAYYTVQDGTAKRADIDLAMQLGTNYPQGPFAWCERVGITNIYHLLDALFQDTRDERYRIAPLLKKEYLRSLTATRYES
jgi:3-hydroxybutyryl-CoA dehydrogenase